MIEDFRAPLVDGTIIELVNDGEIDSAGFTPSDNGGFFMAKQTMKRLTDRLTDIMAQRQRFFSAYDGHQAYGFQAMLDKKILSLINAIEKHDATLYRPFLWKTGDE